VIRRAPERRPHRWATLAHAAEYFDCSTDTIRRYISSGDLPGHYVGKRRSIKVDLNDLDDLAVPIPSARTVSEGGVTSKTAPLGVGAPDAGP